MWRAVCVAACAVLLSGCMSMRAGVGSSIGDAAPRPEGAVMMLGHSLDVGADVSGELPGELWVGYRWHDVSEAQATREEEGRSIYAARRVEGPYVESVIQLIEEDEDTSRAALGVGMGFQALTRPHGEGVEGFWVTMRLQFEEQGISFERDVGLGFGLFAGFSVGRVGREQLWQVTPLGVELKVYDVMEALAGSED